MTERTRNEQLVDGVHLSIGEVLNLLQSEFPDITISKIRFLESQGLIDPERTPSGYRKFYDADIQRLRWILEQQREHFLPLKVIKNRLENEAVGVESTDSTGSPPPPPPPPPPPVSVVAPDPPDAADPGSGARPSRGAAERLLAADDPSVRLTVDQLAKRVGLSHRQLGDLERYGLVVAEPDVTPTTFGPDAVEAAELCGAFISRGVEPRHLRMFKLTAEREAAFLEQLLLPHARRKGRSALNEAVAELAELAECGERIRVLMLREQFRDDIDRAD